MIGKNVRLAVKIGGGFGLFVVLLAVISLGSYVGLQVIADHAHRLLENNNDKSFKLAKEIDHLNWMAKINDLFLKEEVTTLQVETDDHKCGFGKWLYSQETQELINMGGTEAELLKAIEDPHRRLHESAIAIGERYSAFDTEVAKLLPERWIDHLKWVKNLSNSLFSGREFTGGLDPHKCAFGNGTMPIRPATQNLAVSSRLGRTPISACTARPRKLWTSWPRVTGQRPRKFITTKP